SMEIQHHTHNPPRPHDAACGPWVIALSGHALEHDSPPARWAGSSVLNQVKIFALCRSEGGLLYFEMQNACRRQRLRKSGCTMQLTQSTTMRQEMRQLLTPRMIQSMEILQLPLAMLEERIEQELQVNPVLEVNENDPDAPDAELNGSAEAIQADGDQTLVLKDGGEEDFDRLAKISE